MTDKVKEKTGYWSRIMEIKAPIFGQMIEMLRDVFEENDRLKRELVSRQKGVEDLRELANCTPVGSIEDWEKFRQALHDIADVFSAAPVLAHAVTTYWAIERGTPAEYWNLYQGWVSDPFDAERFKTKLEAQKECLHWYDTLDGYRMCEHMVRLSTPKP